MKPFIVTFTPGEAWVAGKTSREQPFWDRHAVFMDGLFADGRIILGGPLEDYSCVIVIVNAADVGDVEAMFADDSFLTNEILKFQSINEWMIFLDSRKANS